MPRKSPWINLDIISSSNLLVLDAFKMLSRCFNPSKSFTSKLPNLCTLKTFRSVHLLLSGKAKPHWNVMQHASKCNLCLHRFMVYKSRPSFDFVYLSPPTIKMTYTSASNTGLPGNVVEPLPGNLLCIGATLISDILCGKNDGRLVLEFWRPPFSRIFQDFRGSLQLGESTRLHADPNGKSRVWRNQWLQ